MAHEVCKAGLAVKHQRSLAVTYDGIIAGEYVAHPIVERAPLVKSKALNALNHTLHAQRINHLKATGPRLGLLLSFGTNDLKSIG